MLRGMRLPLAVALVAATLTACTSDPRGTGQPATRTTAPATRSPAASPSDPATPTTVPEPSAPPRSPSAPVGTGITGQTVLINCPVDRADPPCPGQPVQASLVVLSSTAQTVIASVETDAQGRFSVATPAGAYLLRPVRIGGGPARRPAMLPVTVTAGQYTTVTMRLDNGLR